MRRRKEEKPAAKPEAFKSGQKETKGSVVVEGFLVGYDAYARTLVVRPRKPDDRTENSDQAAKGQPPEASMFYVAYFKSGCLPQSILDLPTFRLSGAGVENSLIVVRYPVVGKPSL